MDEQHLTEYIDAMEGFPSVWARVRGTEPERKAPEKHASLEELILRELESARRDRILARRFPGRTGVVLNSHASKAIKRLSSLRAERFITEGKSDVPFSPPKKYKAGLVALREAMLEDRNLAEIYSSTPVDSKDLQELFQRFSKTASLSADEKKELIRDRF